MILNSIRTPHCRWLRSRAGIFSLRSLLIFAVAVLGLLGSSGFVHSADQDSKSAAIDLFPNFPLDGFGEPAAVPVTWSARYYQTGPNSQTGATDGRLEVIADIGTNWHLYSLTQAPGGPLPTKLSIESPAEVILADAFRPDKPPKQATSAVYNGLTVEEHEEKVVFSAPIQLPGDFRGEIRVRANGLACNDRDGNCLPVGETLTAKFAGVVDNAALSAGPESAGTNRVIETRPSRPRVDPLAGLDIFAQVGGPSRPSEPATSGAAESEPAVVWFRDDDYSVAWHAQLKPARLAPGQNGVLEITAKPDASYHVYETAVDDADSSTNFVVTEKSGLRIGAPETGQVAESHSILPSLPPVRFYPGDVTWKLPIEVPRDAQLGEHKLVGMIAYQACTDNACLQPMALQFTGMLTVVATGSEGATLEPADVKLASAKRADALDAAATVTWVDKLSAGDGSDDAGGTLGRDGVKSTMPFPMVLLFAFIGGVILNVMPCVLPVVGLKVMSFVQQAGEDRGRILKLNVVYVTGILSVFAILAALAVVFSLSWGEQFTYFPVRLGLTLLIFALALSYLGVWEIPVPGMAAGKGSQKLQSREGYTGAFFKGIFATILATPCSGPLLGAILGLTITLRPLETIVVIMTVGLGMSIPYLIIGIRPALVSWLPKPGDWMETLKEFMAFLFLGTVAFFFHQFSDVHKLPVFVALIGVWFGCWMIGKVPNWESIEKRLAAWSGGIASAAIIGFLAFRLLVPAELEPGEKAIHWEPYNETRLAELQAQGRTVMVDFTAKWCVNCIVNYNVALNTEPTRQMLEELDAVAMLADWTDQNERIKSKLEELQSRSIPLLAIYPGRDSTQPIVLRDLVSQDAVLEALRKAGSSVNASSLVTSPQSDRTREVVSSGY